MANPPRRESMQVAPTSSRKRPQTSQLRRAKTQDKKPKQTSVPYLLKSGTKKFTKAELELAKALRTQRYQDLLSCARSKDMTAGVVLPNQDFFAIPMTKVVAELETKVEMLDIYHYLVARQDLFGEFKTKLSYSNFGKIIGCHIPKTTLCRWLAEEEGIRKAAKDLPPGTCYIINRKYVKVEEVLYRWISDQRKQCTPVNGKMIKEAAHVTYTILGDIHDPSGATESDAPPSFTATWLNGFKKRYQITYCQLHGEAGSVDMEEIEAELVEIRNLCSQYSPENIYNCDETGIYLKEPDTKSYTVLRSNSGAKAIRSCRVTLMFCINANGSSLALAKTKSSLRPLIIGKNRARKVEKESSDRMNIYTTDSGWMTRNVFMKWLQEFDDQVTQPTLLLLDSAPAHNNIDKRDPETGTPWRHLRIRRLPKNSTSMTQPLDAGVISVCKRAFLEILSCETQIIRNYDKQNAIANGLAWSLVPYAWSRVKPQTLRNCFAIVPVFPEEMRERLRRQPTIPVEQPEILFRAEYSEQKDKERAYFEQLIAETSDENGWNLRIVGNQDKQDEALQVADELARAEADVQASQDQDNNDNADEGSTESDELGPQSSPIEPQYWDMTSALLKSFAGNHDPFTPEGLQEIRRGQRETNRCARFEEL